MVAYTIADIVGDNAAHVIGTPLTRARWIAITAVGGNLRLGDVNVGAARGVQVAANLPTIIESDGADMTACLDLGNTYVYVPIGTTATITYGS